MKPKTLMCKFCDDGFWTIYGRDRHIRSSHNANGSKDNAGSSSNSNNSNSNGSSNSNINNINTSNSNHASGSSGMLRGKSGANSASTSASKMPKKAAEVDLTDEKENAGQKSKRRKIRLFVNSIICKYDCF